MPIQFQLPRLCSDGLWQGNPGITWSQDLTFELEGLANVSSTAPSIPRQKDTSIPWVLPVIHCSHLPLPLPFLELPIFLACFVCKSVFSLCQVWTLPCKFTNPQNFSNDKCNSSISASSGTAPHDTLSPLSSAWPFFPSLCNSVCDWTQEKKKIKKR